ncbi:unnamed protein product [Cuscuta campestris]|uniref:Hydroperoxide dehydratase n=1 Tax=Cuscuta campestris TaxID=132261 RepID=A0A484KSN8_9ASTE|nr:unnamed protein product [Cuscuta campestris]
MSSSSLSSHNSSDKKLPLREIPGGYTFAGSSFLGAIKDRYDYFYTHGGGPDNFFLSKLRTHGSTVFRTNVPPGPFISGDSRVIAVLDSAAFRILFDNSKVEKRDVLDGTFMPSAAFFGGYRPCSFLDTSEPSHAALKSFILSTLARLHTRFLPFFTASMGNLFSTLDEEVSQKGKAGFNPVNDRASFDFVFRLFCDGKDPSQTQLGDRGTKLVDPWTFFQLHPILSFGLKFVPNFLEDLFLHTFRLPFFAVRSDYEKLCAAFSESASSILGEAEKSGLEREEALHNLVFLACFNSYGGMKVFFPSLIKWVGDAGEDLHRRLSEEIRAVVKEEGGVTVASLEKMSLTKSVVYESLRIEPPIPFQYGKAREDTVVRSHESAFLIKKGETIFGYQPFATKDPIVFADPDRFVPDRFVGEGDRLLRHVYWSNERETSNPTAENKQCPGKDLVVLMGRLLLVELFLRYDSFQVQWEKLPLGSSVTITSFTKRT